MYHLQRLWMTVWLAAGMIVVGDWQSVHAGAGIATSNVVPSAICASQPASRHVPGAVLTGRTFHGLAVDDTTRHVFVLSDGFYDEHDRYTCTMAVLTLSAWNGRVNATTRIDRGVGGGTYASLGLDGPAYRLFAVDSGRSAQTGLGVPDRPGSVSILDTRNGRLLKSLQVGSHPGGIAIDQATYRAFTIVARDPSNAAVASVAVIAVTRGDLIRTVPITMQVQDIAVDQRTNRVFLLGSNAVTMLDGGTGKILNTVDLPSGFYQYNNYGLDQKTGRLFVSAVGLAPPHSGESGNPPNSLSIVDTRTGNLVRTIFAGHGVLVGRVVVDEPKGIVISVTTNTDSTTASILDARDGSVRGQVVLPLPIGGFGGPTAIDPRTGAIFGFSGRGISVVQPGAWRKRHAVAGRVIIGFDLQISATTHRLFTMEWDLPSDPYRNTIRAFCTSPPCT